MDNTGGISIDHTDILWRIQEASAEHIDNILNGQGRRHQHRPHRQHMPWTRQEATAQTTQLWQNTIISLTHVYFIVRMK